MLLLLGAIVIGSCSSGTPASFKPEAMQQTLQTLQGDPITFEQILGKHKGKTLVVEVWASWCSDCIKAMPDTKALAEKHPDVSFVFLSADKTPEKWREGIGKYELKGEHYWITDGMKGEFGKSIDLDWIPRYIIIGPDQNVVTYRAIEKDFDAMDKTLTQLQ